MFRFARTSRPMTTCALTLADRAPAGRAAAAMVDELLGGKALADDHGDPIVHGRRDRARPTTCPRSSTASSSSPPSARARAWPRFAGGRRSTTEQAQRLAEALSQATGKQVEVKVVVDPSRARRRGRTIGDTVIDGTVRHRLEPARRNDLGTQHLDGELTINADDIAAALRQNVEGLHARRSRPAGRRVLEVGDGIARVRGPAERGGERAARVRGRHARPRAEPRRGLDRRGRARRGRRGRRGLARCSATGRILSVPVGDALLGRVVNALGEPIDGKGPISRARAAPHGDPGAGHHRPQAGARAAADRHQGHRRHDPDRPGPARADHRRPQDRQDHGRASTRS